MTNNTEGTEIISPPKLKPYTVEPILKELVGNIEAIVGSKDGNKFISSKYFLTSGFKLEIIF